MCLGLALFCPLPRLRLAAAHEERHAEGDVERIFEERAEEDAAKAELAQRMMARGPVVG